MNCGVIPPQKKNEVQWAFVQKMKKFPPSIPEISEE